MSKRVIKAGTYRTLASTNIGKGRDVMLLDDFMSNLRQAQKLFANSTKKQPETFIGISGIQNSSTENVQPLGDGQQAFKIIEGIENASIFLGLDRTQLDLNMEMEEEKEQLIKDNFVKIVNTGNRIAEELANSSVQAQQLNKMLENNPDAHEIRGVLARAAKPEMAVQFEDGLEVVVGGGLPVPKRLPKGKPISFKNAIVSYVSQSGLVKIQVSYKNEDGDEGVKFIKFIVNRKINDFNLLNIARVFQTRISVFLNLFEQVSNAKERLELLEIENRKQILAELMEKLKLWDENI